MLFVWNSEVFNLTHSIICAVVWTHSTISMQVQNLVLEVLLANLMVTQSVRVTVCSTFAPVLMSYFNYAVGQWVVVRDLHASCMMLLYPFFFVSGDLSWNHGKFSLP